MATPAGVQVASLQEAHDLLEQILNSHLAPLAFGLALLLTGQMSTFTSTIAGQVVMSGFLGVKSSPLSRRLSTRALAVLPALYVQINYGTEGTYKCDAAFFRHCMFLVLPNSSDSTAITKKSVCWNGNFIPHAATLTQPECSNACSAFILYASLPVQTSRVNQCSSRAGCWWWRKSC